MHSVIKSSFWADASIESMSPDEKLALIWLFSNPALDLCGFTRTTPRRFHFETGLDISVLDSACGKMGSSVAMPGDGVYFSRKFIRHQFGKGGRVSLANLVVKAAVKTAEMYPEHLRELFFADYPEFNELRQYPHEKTNSEAASSSSDKGLPSPSEALRKGKRERMGNGKEKVQGKGKEKEYGQVPQEQQEEATPAEPATPSRETLAFLPAQSPAITRTMRKTLTCLMLATSCLHADEDTFREKYADPATRMAALAELIPGSRDAYFHTALAHQLAGREAEFRKVMAEWKAATERKEYPVPDHGHEVLENRQLLLAYQADPEASIEGLIRKLGLKFDHSRPDAAAEAETVPTRLDSAAISVEAFEERAAKSSAPSTAYQRYTGRRLMDELAGAADFDEAKVRWFLENIQHAEHPAVTLLVERSLAFPAPVKFGSMEVHGKLVFQQLDALLKLRPELLSDEAFNTAYLAKMRPGAEVDFDRDRQAHAEHLRRCLDHAMKLPPALNSLKAHVLHHHLRLQSELGRMPKEDFLAYLALPRQENDLFPKEKPGVPSIVLSSGFADATGCPNVPDERPLLELYLDHFLGVDDDAAAEFAPFIRTEKLREMQARARLLAGAATDLWGSVLSPEAFKALNGEAFIRFAPGAPEVMAAGAQAALTLDLKNTPELHIRIYELDLPAHLARTGAEPEVSMDLEGLVPHHERQLKYGYAPLQRHR
ncbi:MAG: hypothetical protein EOP87_13095, partial [Verrucomicrobiaceae bacterium]